MVTRRRKAGRVKVHHGPLPKGVPIPGKQDRIVNKPPKDYAERLEAVANTVAECMTLGREHAGVPSRNGRHYYASVLFTGMIVRAVTLVFVAPYSPWSRRTFEHWDHASVANITRTILETRLNFFYLCAEPVSDDEWNCRWNLFNLHDCCARVDLMGVLGDLEQHSALAAQSDELRQRLVANPCFTALPEKRQRELLRGKKAH